MGCSLIDGINVNSVLTAIEIKIMEIGRIMQREKYELPKETYTELKNKLHLKIGKPSATKR